MNSNDYFASLLGDKPGKTSSRRTTVVTPNTIAKVRQEQAEDAFAAERAELAASQDALREELEAQREACESLARDLAILREEHAALLARAESAEAASAAVHAELEAERAKPHIDESLIAESEAKDREIDRLKELLAEAQRTSLSSSVLLEKPPALGAGATGVHASWRPCSAPIPPQGSLTSAARPYAKSSRMPVRSSTTRQSQSWRS